MQLSRLDEKLKGWSYVLRSRHNGCGPLTVNARSFLMNSHDDPCFLSESERLGCAPNENVVLVPPLSAVALPA